MNTMQRRKIRRLVRLVWVLAGIGGTLWLVAGFQAAGVPEATMANDDRVTVVDHEYGIDFRPRTPRSNVALVFLPGGMVDPLAYAPLLKNLARAGYHGYMMRLPWRSSFTEAQTRELFSRIRAKIGGTPSVLAGHSRGGMLAARFARESPEMLKGMALLGTTHPRDFDLSSVQIPVTKIYGSKDGIASYEAMKKHAHLLPPQTKWIRIEGGNHVQFGYYRHQFGDDSARISRDEQQRAVEKAIIDLLSAVR